MTEIALIPHNKESIAQRGDRHFLYESDKRAFDPADVAAVGVAVRDMVKTGMNLMAAEIEIMSLSQFQSRATPNLIAASQRMVRALDLTEEQHNISFVFCDWAAPHEDLYSAGCVFVSTVLHTGPYPYWMSMFHSRVHEKSGESPLLTSTRIIRQGDTFVFDPTIPHMTAPVRPHQDQFLVLMQAELPIRTEAQLQAVIDRFPRAAHDCDKDFITAKEELARSETNAKAA